MASENSIGDFLRARREQVQPEVVGLPDFGRRRVPGLRREELAMLAGVSSDYYVRLEQGRERHPSEQVLDALARALMLTPEATAHLHDLARPAPRRRRRRARAEEARPGLVRLMDSWHLTPAFITGRRTDVLAANQLATALNPAYAPGVNLVRSVFLEEAAARALYVDYDAIAAHVVASLRTTVGPDLDDPALIELVGELSLKSELFRRLWGRHDVHETYDGVKRMMHPTVGLLDLRYEALTTNGADGQLLIAHFAEPGTPTEQSLQLLATIIGERTQPQPQTRDPIPEPRI
jgi:transcriptional regulator with XRE-family HTH domain